ncbi:MAG: glycosyltransferase family 4 protein [candidate division Zixibacteria bacterium]|nr:glycosyltransferase family 4 protein [candidate division Zixibacteria bacterium]
MNNPLTGHTAATLTAALPSNAAAVDASRRLTLMDARSNSDVPDLTAECLSRHAQSDAGRKSLEVVFTGRFSISSLFGFFGAIRRSDTAVIFLSNLISALVILFPALVFGRFYHKRIIAHVGGQCLMQSTSWHRRLLKPLLARVDHLATSTDRSAMALARLGLKATVVGPVLPEVAARSIQAVQPHLILTVRDYNEVEMAQVIGAHALVKQKYPRAILSIVAPKKFHRRIRTLAQSERHSAAHAVALVPEDRQSELLEQGDVCICSHSDSGAPVDLLLCWRYGLPAIASDFSAAAELIRDHENGLVFTALHPSSLADRIIELIEDPRLAARLSANGIAEAKRYSWTAVEPHWRRLLALPDAG